MAQQADDQATASPPVQEFSEPRRDPVFSRDASRAKGPAPLPSQPGGKGGPDSLPGGAEDGREHCGDNEHRGFLRRHPLAVLAGAAFFALRAQRTVDQANLAQANAQRDQAALNLSYTTITAAQPGHVANLSAAVGEYVAAGTSLTMFVPDAIWVDANYKATQLDAMRPGELAWMRIDAYPERAIRGHVATWTSSGY